MRVWKKCLFVSLMLVLGSSVAAQTAYTPPVLPPIFGATDLSNSAILMTNVNQNVKVYTQVLLKHDQDLYGAGVVSALRASQQADAQAIAALVDQTAQITALKAQVATYEARITALETKLGALVTKTVSAGTTLATP